MHHGYTLFIMRGWSVCVSICVCSVCTCVIWEHIMPRPCAHGSRRPIPARSVIPAPCHHMEASPLLASSSKSSKGSSGFRRTSSSRVGVHVSRRIQASVCVMVSHSWETRLFLSLYPPSFLSSPAIINPSCFLLVYVWGQEQTFRHSCSVMSGRCWVYTI